MPKLLRSILVVLAAAVIVGAGLYWAVTRGPGAVAELAARLAVERSEAARLFVKINGVAGQSKLVVAESATVATGAYESSKSVLGVDLGTTALTYEVPVRYLYAVDLGGEAPIDFVLDAEQGILWARFPALELLAVEPDLGKLEQQLEVGWGRLERFSGQDVRERFRERVMTDLRARGTDYAAIVAVRATARARLLAMTRAFLDAYAPAAAAEVRDIEVRFADERARPAR